MENGDTNYTKITNLVDRIEKDEKLNTNDKNFIDRITKLKTKKLSGQQKLNKKVAQIVKKINDCDDIKSKKDVKFGECYDFLVNKSTENISGLPSDIKNKPNINKKIADITTNLVNKKNENTNFDIRLNSQKANFLSNLKSSNSPEIKKPENTVEISRDILSESLDISNKLNDLNKNIREELSVCNATKEVLQQQNIGLDENLEVCNLTIDEKISQNKNLSSELENLSKDKSSCERKQDLLNLEIVDLKFKNDELSRKNNNLETNLKTINYYKGENESKISELQTELNKRDSQVNVLRDLTDKVEKEVEILGGKLETTTKELSACIVEKSNIENLPRIKDLKLQNEKLVDDIKSLKSQLNSPPKSVESPSFMSKIKSGVSSGVEALKNKIPSTDSLKDKISSLSENSNLNLKGNFEKYFSYIVWILVALILFFSVWAIINIIKTYNHVNNQIEEENEKNRKTLNNLIINY